MMAGPKEILEQYWGHTTFREPQEAIIASVLSGKDTFAILPTGAGKSVCYQVPALLMEGMCLVISPLIALMRDQVEHLQEMNIAAAGVYSGMSVREIDEALENAATGKYKLLYVSPERLKTKIFKARLERMKIGLVAVDEAHCISEWGYDFRPPYLEIAELRKSLPGVPFLALTASATPGVEKDIIEKLRLDEPAVFRKSFVRPNIAIGVLFEEAKSPKLLELVEKMKGSGIIYVRSRKLAEQVAQFLRKNDQSAGYYHAGLKSAERTKRQQEWQQGDVRIIACTNAFGMGIDKADVRFVIHAELPDSPEAYYQEAGRAGRDGKMSYAIVLYKNADITGLDTNVMRQFPELETVKRVYDALCNYLGIAVNSGEDHSYKFDLQHFCQQFNLPSNGVLPVLKVLQQEGYILLSDSVGMPSRVKFSMDRSSLYRYQLDNKDPDPFIKLLLRSYGGILDHYTSVREQLLARKMKVEESAVIRLLQQLRNNHVLYYEQATDMPSITFLVPRVPSQTIRIDKKRWDSLLEKKLRRTEAMKIFILEDRKCRQQVLTEYFGEKDVEPCGICDNCKKNNSPIPDVTLRNMVLSAVNGKGVALEKIKRMVPVSSGRDRLLEQVRLLIDEKILSLSKDDVISRL